MSEYNAENARSLLLQRRLVELIEYVEPFAEAGNVEAAVELSRALKLSGKPDECDEWLIAAERAHYRGLTALWMAFSSMSLGPADIGLRDERAHLYQQMLAESGNVRACEALMYNYLQGRNGYAIDDGKFEYWALRAKDLGSEVAADMLEKRRKSGAGRQ